VIILLVLVLVVALGVVAYAAQGRTVPIDMELTGTFIPINESAGIFDVNLQGSPGKAHARGLSVGLPVEKGALPSGNKCVDIPDSPDGLLTTEAQLNMIFNDGSMLFGTMAEGSYLCFVPNTVYAPYEIVGGTGRFEGATGEVNFDITTHPIGTGTVVGESGTGTGEIILP